MMQRCLEALFPRVVVPRTVRLPTTYIPLFTREELCVAVKRLSTRRNLGLDVVPEEAM